MANAEEPRPDVRSVQVVTKMQSEPLMEIQDESPLLSDPLADLEDDYHHAVLHLAWDRHSLTKERTLLFAFVELLPAEIPPPIDDYDPTSPRCSRRLAHDSLHYVYVRHAVATAQQALAWYRACREGVAVLPENDGRVPRTEDTTAKRLKVAMLGQEPVWPTLISAFDNGDTIPFAPQWIEHPRIHHLLPLTDFDRDALWSEDEAEAARRWLAAGLHFDLGEFPEYWCSIHLVAPNPVYREMAMRLQSRLPPNESVIVRFQPRMGRSVEGLDLTFREEDPWGLTASRQTTLRSSLSRMNFDREVNAVTTDVWDPRRGFLQVGNEAHAFISSIQFDLNLGQRTIVQNGEQSFEVTRFGKPERSTVGAEHNVREARHRMLTGHDLRKKRRVASTHDQRWFRQQKGHARDVLRSLLNEANSNVLVIDPYFAAEEFGGFVLAVGRYDIPINVLTSAEVLKEGTSKGSEIEKGDQLLKGLQELQRHDRMNPFEIRVMAREKPAVHDRFLVIDSRIWLLGSSLNEFGSRGTMILALPDPDAVRGDLEKAWNESEGLEAWVTRRRQNRRSVDGERT